MKPILNLKSYPHGLKDILKKFEEGKPLSGEQVHFLASHARALSNSTLDPVLRYYLREHKRQPDKALPLELPQAKLTESGFQQVKQNIHLLLRNNLSQVDLQMTPEQFQQFKAAGLDELVFWHGEHHLSNSIFYHSGLPYRVYFQWGRLFGVVKIEWLSCGKRLEGKVLIFLEDRHEKNLEQCVHAYISKLKEEQQHELKLTQVRDEQQSLSSFKLPTPAPGFSSAKPKDIE